jgi:hypothetical protein
MVSFLVMDVNLYDTCFSYGHRFNTYIIHVMTSFNVQYFNEHWDGLKDLKSYLYIYILK